MGVGNMRVRCLLVFMAFIFSINCFGYTNHAPLHENHVSIAEDFISRHLKNDQGQYDILTFELFLKRLKKERKHLISDAYETKLIEKLELELEGFKDAKKAALKELDEKKNGLIKGYNLYLIPKIKKAIQLVRSEAPTEMIDGAIDEFIELYKMYYLPEAIRNIWHHDISPVTRVLGITGYGYSPTKEVKAEANNLVVGSLIIDKINTCLSSNHDEDHILLESEIRKLKSCAIDISILNPVKNPLMDLVPNPEVKHKVIFPSEDEKLTFRKIKYGSSGSPKLQASFERDGKTYKVKVKMGFEVHSEVATSELAKSLGMHQDPIINRAKVKLYLGKNTYEAFIAKWRRKYRQDNRDVANYIESRSSSDEKEQWVVLRDVAIESSYEGVERLEGYHPEGWDHFNRREHRSLVLWYGFVNMFDTKAGNHKVLIENIDSDPRILYSMQDVGYSLHHQINFSDLVTTVKGAFRYGVNSFNKSMLSKKDNGGVHIWWADVMQDQKKFQGTTWSDVKWMARRIANLKKSHIENAFKKASYPKPVEQMYIYKIFNRRNEIIKAFNLEQEYELYEVPDLDSYSVPGLIENGEVIVDNFEGYTNNNRSHLGLLPIVLDAVSSFLNTELIAGKIMGRISSRLELGVNDENSLWDGENTKNFNFNKIMSNFGINFNRSVSKNSQRIDRGLENNQVWVVKDRLSIKIGVGTGFLSKVMKDFPVSVGAGLKVWQRDFEYIHFSNDWKKGFLKPFEIFKYFYRYKKAIPELLKKGEVFKVSDSYGFNIGASTSSVVNGLQLDASIHYSWQKSNPVYFGRDSFGQLYVLQDKIRSKGISAGVNYGLSDFIMFKAPVLGLNFSFNNYTYESEYYEFDLPVYELLGNRYRENKENELIAFNLLLNEGGDNIPALVRRKYSIIGKAKVRRLYSKFLFLFGSNVSSGESEIDVTLRNGIKRKFYRAFRETSQLGGVERVNFISDLSHTSVLQQNITSVWVETDAKDLERMTGLLEFTFYKRKLKKKRLLKFIDQLNKKFSKSKEKPFFRDYVLPSKSEVPYYRKLHAKTRVFVKGKNLIKRLKTLKQSELSYFFRKFERRCLQSRRMGLCKENTYLERFTKLRKEILKAKDNPKKLTSLFAEFLYLFKVQKYGLEVLRDVMGPKAIFVMGEIHGILPSFTTMQQQEAVAGRRFAGHSWGSYKYTPPIRKFLKENDFSPVSIHANTNGSLIDLLFGRPPEVQAPRPF